MYKKITVNINQTKYQNILRKEGKISMQILTNRRIQEIR